MFRYLIFEQTNSFPRLSLFFTFETHKGLSDSFPSYTPSMASYCTKYDISPIEGSFSANEEEHRTIRFLPVLVIHKIRLGGGKESQDFFNSVHMFI